VIFVETPANPTNALVDIAECVRVAKALADEKGMVRGHRGQHVSRSALQHRSSSG